MTESLLDTPTADAAGSNGLGSDGLVNNGLGSNGLGSDGLGSDAATMTAAPGETTSSPAVRPPGLPDKFWDESGSNVRTDALLKSYNELERKLGGLAGAGVPVDPNGYEITAGDDSLFTSDPDVNARLHKAGFTQDQAQMVYSMAQEYMHPMVMDLAAEFEAHNQIERLSDHFGGGGKWGEISRQLKQWGGANYPPEVFNALSCTYDGVLSMHRMMSKGEPALIHNGQSIGNGPSEQGLRQLMRDPRYWREREPEIVQQVRDGFQRLYPNEE